MRATTWPLLAALAFSTLAGPTAADAPSETDRLAGQAQDILGRHCRACHSATGSRAGLNVFDRKQLLERGLINVRDPGASELLDLVQSGSMPPGTNRKVSVGDQEILRNWI